MSMYITEYKSLPIPQNIHTSLPPGYPTLQRGRPILRHTCSRCVTTIGWGGYFYSSVSVGSIGDGVSSRRMLDLFIYTSKMNFEVICLIEENFESFILLDDRVVY